VTMPDADRVLNRRLQKLNPAQLRWIIRTVAEIAPRPVEQAVDEITSCLPVPKVLGQLDFDI
jgi:hypothetical protein